MGKFRCPNFDGRISMDKFRGGQNSVNNFLMDKFRRTNFGGEISVDNFSVVKFRETNFGG